MMNIVDCLRISASKFPDKTGFIFEDIPYTYAQVVRAAEELAGEMNRRGIGHGDKVCALFHNSIEQVQAYFATLMLGAVIVPVNFRFIDPEIHYIADDSDAKAILHGPEFSALVQRIKPGLPKIAFSMSLDVQNRVPGEPRAVEKGVSPTLLLNGPDMLDVSFISYTSGTTGNPKGAILTHANNVWNQVRIIIDTPITPSEVIIGVLPIFHASGMSRLLASVTVGGTLVSWKHFDPAKTMAAVSKYGGTFLLLVPAMARMIFALPGLEKYPVHSLTKCLLTAAPVSESMKKQALALFYNAAIIDGYGLTENTSSTTMLKGEDVITRPSSVGLPDIFTQIRIFNNAFEPVPPGSVGEIGVRSPTVMKGYYKNPQATAETLRDGWLLTGDLGRMDEDGYLYVVGRKKEMIISGGENIYPAEVEAVLNRHPKILESAVIGVPDPKWGETVMALIAPAPGEIITEEEVEQYCIETMARYKRPRIIKVVDALVKTMAGKIKKQELKKIYSPG